MKRFAGYFLLLLTVFFTLNVNAQFDPDKICRLNDGQLIFTINLKWNEKEKKELCNLFDLDSALVSQVFAGKTSINFEGENWVVKKLQTPLVELSKPVQISEQEGMKENDVLLVIDQWMNFGGKIAENPAIWGVNDFSLSNAFVYKSGRASFFLPGFEKANRIFLAGSFNKWSPGKIPMNKVSGGWAVNIPLDPGKHTYKYVVDGRWITDPVNRKTEHDWEGNRNSVLICSNHVFNLKGYLKAKKVVLTGNFYDWNPGGIEMMRNSEGWSLPVYLREGTYSYKFLVDGKWMTDPANPSVRKDAKGNDNSFLEIGEPFIFKLNGFTDAEKVVLTGSFNNWNETELVMDKTATGWQLRYVVAPGNYEYKFIVDGKWMTDPENPFTIGNDNYTNSIVALKANHIFELKGFENAKNVIVTGNFSGWKPDGYKMSKQNNKWILPLNLLPGKYVYKFIVDGKWILDPANNLYEENEYGTDNSVLWIED